MRLRTGALWLTIAALALSACGGDPYAVGELTPFISPDLGFRVDYPSNWDATVDPVSLVGSQPDKLHAVAFASLASNTIFVVYVQELDGAEALDEFATRQIDSLRAVAGQAAFSDPIPTQLGGLDALATHTTVAQNGLSLTQRAVLAVKDRRGYLISVVAPTDSPLAATLADMLASFGYQP